jgi:uncharacterized cupin superfamily protein
VNLRDLELQEEARARAGHRFSRRMLGQDVGAKATGFSVYELPAGEKAWAYHWEVSREEWLIVVSGEVVVRTPQGERPLRAGDTLFFPIGPDGAHQIRNDSEEAARFAIASSYVETYAAVRPDSNTLLVVGPDFRQIVPLDESLEYWDREP